MLDEVVEDYAAYLKLDITNGFQIVQDVIDNMLTRLEELTSVLQMIKIKNGDCNNAVADDIRKYKNEVNILSKKIATLNVIILKLHSNVEILEKEVDKAEVAFGLNNDNKLKSLLKPFLKRNKDPVPVSNTTVIVPEKLKFQSVLDNFENES